MDGYEISIAKRIYIFIVDYKFSMIRHFLVKKCDFDVKAKTKRSVEF